MITTVTLNASIDKAYYLEGEIKPGEVMRVVKCRNTAGGKGINVAKIIHLCKEEVFALGFSGGFSGRYLKYLLEQEEIPYKFVEVEGETRSCINVIDKEFGSTEFLEPGFTVTNENEIELLREFGDAVQKSTIITISGSTPGGVSEDIYQKIIHIAKKYDRKVILDTSGKLLKHALSEKPTMVKPNKDELEMLFKRELATNEQVIECAREIYDMGIPYVVVSLGAEGAVLICREGTFRGVPPKINAVNTVGCGDSMVGAFAVAMLRGYSPENALAYAAAVATANALSENTGDFEYGNFERIMEQVWIEKFDKRGEVCH